MDRKDIITWSIWGVLVVLAGWFRLYDIQSYPPGLFPDQAANGEDALLILEGDTRPFYPRGNGREGLFFYLDAASIFLFGVGVWQLHAVSAAVGIGTVALMYPATRPWFGRVAGLLATYFLATNYWHVTLSRTGFRAILIPLFVAAFTAAVGYTIQAVKKKKVTQSYTYAALAGAVFTGGFYTYIAYRVMIGVVIGIVVLLLLAALHPKIGFPHVRRYGKQVIIAAMAGLIVFLPLGWYFAQHPEAFVGRAGQVSIFSPDLQREYGGGTLLGTLLYSTRETLLSFFVGAGDLNWRHNVAGYPLLNPLMGVLFLLGLAWTIQGTVVVTRSIIRGKEVHLGMIYPYALLLLVGMLLPVITTAEGLPHGLRSVGLIAPIFLLAGTAGAVIIHWVVARFPKEPTKALLLGGMAGILVVSGVYDGLLYFFVSRNDSEAAYAYRADLTGVAAYINEYAARYPDGPRPYLVLDRFSVQTIHFLQHTYDRAARRASPPAHDYLDHPDEAQHKYEALDPATSHLTPLAEGRVIIFTQSTIFDADRYVQTHGAAIELVESRRNRFGEEIMRIYQAADDSESAPAPDEFDLDA